MRVLHVLRPAAGGMVTHVRSLCPELEKLGWEPLVATPAHVEFGSSFHASRLNLAISPSFNLGADLAAAECVASQRVDLIHAHGLRGLWIAALATRRWEFPTLATLHNIPPQMGLATRVVAGWAVRRMSGLIAVSKAASKLPFRRSPRQPLWVIPNGIALPGLNELPSRESARHQLGLPIDAPIVGAVGRIAPEKGFDLLVEAMAEVKEQYPNVRAVVAGGGMGLDALIDDCRKSDLLGTVSFLGRFEDPWPIYRAANVIVIPSRSEAFGLVAVEAGAAERAVVAANIGGLPEVVIPNLTGYLYDGGSNGLATTLVRALGDMEALDDMGLQGRLNAEREFTAAQMAKHTAVAYQQVMNLLNPAHGDAVPQSNVQ